jgi:hypothetical protein
MSTLGDIATIAAPTIVAVAAIGTSTWQQSRSRAFDRAEREKEREHDRLMHERTEAHERALSDLDYQRALMDEVAVALHDVNSALATLTSHVFLHGTPPAQPEQLALADASGALKLQAARLALRLSATHEIVRIAQEAHGAAIAVVFDVGFFSIRPDVGPARAKATLTSSHERITVAIDRFLIAVGNHTGAAATNPATA